MTTLTCTVCGAATATPGRDHTCPVCGADLPTSPTSHEDVEDREERADRDDAASIEDTAEADHHDDASGPGGPTPPPPPPTWPTGSTSATEPPPASPPPTSPPPPGGWAPAVATTAHDPTHPSGLSSSLRTFGMLTHLSAFAGAVIALAFVGPLVMWLIRRDEHPFLDHHGKEALNFNLSMLLYAVIGIVASVATLGLGLVIVGPAAIVFFVTWVVTTIVGAVKANAGEGYRYPLTIRFIKD